MAVVRHYGSSRCTLTREHWSEPQGALRLPRPPFSLLIASSRTSTALRIAAFYDTLRHVGTPVLCVVFSNSQLFSSRLCSPFVPVFRRRKVRALRMQVELFRNIGDLFPLSRAPVSFQLVPYCQLQFLRDFPMFKLAQNLFL